MSTADGRRGTKQRGKAAALDRERKDRDDTQHNPPSTAQSSSGALSTSSVEELRAALSAIPAQTGYLILDHHATTLASSGLLASTSASAPLFHRLLLDVRGLLDHTPDRGREPVQSVTIDYATYRYTVTVTPHFIIAVHVSQAAATHSGTYAADGDADEQKEQGDEGEV